jgi:hypothetical protein
VCDQVFGPLGRLSRKFCSQACKGVAQSNRPRRVRRTTTKARNAQSLLRYHVQVGHIVRPDACEACGATGGQIEGAHFNYDEPLRVRWLCVRRHRQWDRECPKNGTYLVEGAPGQPRRTDWIDGAAAERERLDPGGPHGLATLADFGVKG